MEEHQKRLLMGILLFGSLWGLLEVSLGGFLHSLHLIGRGTVMASIGAFILSMAYSAYRKPGMLPIIGIIASSLKSLNFLIYANPFTFRPMAAIFLESLVLGAFLTLIERDTLRSRMLCGILSGAVSSGGYILLSHFGTSGLIRNVVFHSLVGGMGFTLALTLDYLIVTKHIKRWISESTSFPISSKIIILLCWILICILKIP